MTTTYETPDNVADGILNRASGAFTSDGNDTVITLGFVPKWVKVVNSTDAIVWEKIYGMAAANSVKIIDTTMSIDTGSAIVIGTDGTFTLEAATVGTSKAIAWIAMG